MAPQREDVDTIVRQRGLELVGLSILARVPYYRGSSWKTENDPLCLQNDPVEKARSRRVIFSIFIFHCCPLPRDILATFTISISLRTV